MYDTELQALDLQPEVAYNLGQADLLIKVAQQTRNELLGISEEEAEAAGYIRPAAYSKNKDLPIESRSKAAIITSVIGRVSYEALRAQAYGMQLQTVQD